MTTTLGFIGSGSMARAMARGWSRPFLCTDVVGERAESLARDLSGEAAGSNAEVAERADILVLAHKPQQLDEVAGEIGDRARDVLSILGGVGLPEIRRAYPEARVVRCLPSTPVEVGRGVVLVDAASDEVIGLPELLSELGPVVELPEPLMDVGMLLTSNAPAFWSLLVEAQVDAAVRHGMAAGQATELVLHTMAGTAALLQAGEPPGDTLAARRAVTSPGGSTARGLDALERGGIRSAVQDAFTAVLRP